MLHVQSPQAPSPRRVECLRLHGHRCATESECTSVGWNSSRSRRTAARILATSSHDARHRSARRLHMLACITGWLRGCWWLCAMDMSRRLHFESQTPLHTQTATSQSQPHELLSIQPCQHRRLIIDFTPSALAPTQRAQPGERFQPPDGAVIVQHAGADRSERAVTIASRAPSPAHHCPPCSRSPTRRRCDDGHAAVALTLTRTDPGTGSGLGIAPLKRCLARGQSSSEDIVVALQQQKKKKRRRQCLPQPSPY